MFWFVVLGLISSALILTGCVMAAGRLRRYREETQARRARAFAEMREIAEGQGAPRPGSGQAGRSPSTELGVRSLSKEAKGEGEDLDR